MSSRVEMGWWTLARIAPIVGLVVAACTRASGVSVVDAQETAAAAAATQAGDCGATQAALEDELAAQLQELGKWVGQAHALETQVAGLQGTLDVPTSTPLPTETDAPTLAPTPTPIGQTCYIPWTPTRTPTRTPTPTLTLTPSPTGPTYTVTWTPTRGPQITQTRASPEDTPALPGPTPLPTPVPPEDTPAPPEAIPTPSEPSFPPTPVPTNFDRDGQPDDDQGERGDEGRPTPVP